MCFLVIPSNFGWNMSPVKLKGLKSAGTLHEVKLVINAREDFSNSLGGDFEIHLYIYIYVCMFLSQSILQSPDILKYDKCQANLDVRNSYAKYHRFSDLEAFESWIIHDKIFSKSIWTPRAWINHDKPMAFPLKALIKSKSAYLLE